MMVPLLQSLRAGQPLHGVPMERFYARAGTSRQGFSQAECRLWEESAQWSAMEKLVVAYRKSKDRRAGSRSLFYNLGIKGRFGIGVNKFERWMSKHGLCLAPLRTRVVTTRSSMQSWNHPNLANGLTVNGINQVVAGDLTYVNINGQRFFLFCLTDLYSARIVGHHIGRTMRAVDAKKALDMWARLRGQESLEDCIHHTDGGAQYFSRLYLGAVAGLGARVSCARTCLANGHAEQRNGLVKHHLLPTIGAPGRGVPHLEVKQAIKRYNDERKQQALGWLSPAAFEEKAPKMDIRPELRLFDFKAP